MIFARQSDTRPRAHNRRAAKLAAASPRAASPHNDRRNEDCAAGSKLRRIGVASTIVVKGDMTLVSGKYRKGEPFAIRLRHCADMDELDAFADECDELRTNPRKSGDLILVRQSDA